MGVINESSNNTLLIIQLETVCIINMIETTI